MAHFLKRGGLLLFSSLCLLMLMSNLVPVGQVFAHVRQGVNITGGFRDCPTEPSGVFLAPITVPVNTTPKPYSIIYGPLELRWIPVAHPATPIFCQLNAFGTLPISIKGLTFWNGTATVTLDFMGPGFNSAGIPLCNLTSMTGVRNNCFFNKPGPHPEVVRWSTQGFTVNINGLPTFSTGPRAFYVDAASLFGHNLSVSAVLQRVMTFIHITQTTHFPLLNSVTSFQEPPNDLVVTDSSGNRTGRLPNGHILLGIPGSIYIPGTAKTNASVFIINHPRASYTIELFGKPGARFTLVSSFADFSSNGLSPTVTAEAVKHGVLNSRGVAFTCFNAIANNSCQVATK
jgi:hypothetical protein